MLAKIMMALGLFQGPEIRALRRLQREQGLSSHVFLTERDGPMTPKAFHALFLNLRRIDLRTSGDNRRSLAPGNPARRGSRGCDCARAVRLIDQAYECAG